ncbi:phosphatase FkbH-likeprotein [Candidatus Termititenax persephonae]|uniref:Phosphatase FkbH-likeprotein n=1 Tax=Candidatus Termititenax persephonae TaxID=2218525 RepID=A0A388TI12_9BACT|nr:phosphatase FkbH-likeprotein [Candidatus Termititenax persephonae]
MRELEYPLNGADILLRKKILRRELQKRAIVAEKKIALLSGSTVGEIKDVLEIFLWNYGIRPIFLEGTYANFYEDVMFDAKKLQKFNPDFIYIHTTCRNLTDASKLEQVWAKLAEICSAMIIQNNFELPPDGFSSIDKLRSLNRLNQKIYLYAGEHDNFVVNDLNYLAAQYGLLQWHNPAQWYAYKYALALEAVPLLCFNLAKLIKASLGLNKKVLVLDLDNTLWGGILGDDGVAGLEIGAETPRGAAFLDFQKYLKGQQAQGILLAICSKNNYQDVVQAFADPRMFLRLDDFVAVEANWDNKDKNILKIAEKLNLLPDSFVFVDDNPAERELVRHNVAGVSVVDTSDVLDFIDYIENNGFFLPLKVTEADLNRQEYYQQNNQRRVAEEGSVNYADFLKSLQMTYAIEPVAKENFARVLQLINKTNQFNLTTKRLSAAELQNLLADKYLTICCGLKDKFGDNGIIAVFSAERRAETLDIGLWLMSCRVFRRNVEQEIFKYVLDWCRKKQIKKIHGHYIPTPKNKMTADFYATIGFVKIAERDGGSDWEYILAKG